MEGLSVARGIAEEWGLELGEPFELSRYSYVAPVGADAVLKVTPPEDDESDEGADALELWGGDGAVRLLRRDRERRALLLERARPGADISGLPEEEATAIAVEVGSRLWRPAAAPFRWIGDHVPRWLAADESELTSLARDLYASLDVGRTTLVHGDFHHHNVLRSERGWLAIDPKPMLGEPEYDVPPFLWNPLPCRLRVEHLESRIRAFVAAGLDEERIRKWTVIRGAYLQPQEAEPGTLRLLVS
ncbi:MAG TPA: aminoglycoside phosphotransferase family protein [Gaiellaceae bacterium]|nr:aminoglycoside phosphotransferase family protein [Gaiellaceae bacterium]